MPKQLFQRPSHINRSSMGKPGHPGQQTDWSRKKGRPPKVKTPASSKSEPKTAAPNQDETSSE